MSKATLLQSAQSNSEWCILLNWACNKKIIMIPNYPITRPAKVTSKYPFNPQCDKHLWETQPKLHGDIMKWSPARRCHLFLFISCLFYSPTSLHGSLGKVIRWGGVSFVCSLTADCSVMKWSPIKAWPRGQGRGPWQRFIIHCWSVCVCVAAYEIIRFYISLLSF